MPTYALLGATGATGSAILRALLASPPADLRLNILVRNKPKLLAAFPGLESTASPTIQIYEGPADSLPTMQACLTDADAIFVCIAVNVARPGERIFQDIARTIVDALLAIRDQPPSQRQQQLSRPSPPSVLVLRALPLNPVFGGDEPWFAHHLLWFALHHCYTAMQEATAFYEAQVRAHPGLFEVVFVDPPGIQDPEGQAPATGYALSVEKKPGDPPLKEMVSYADLGKAFVELAARRGEFAGKGVAVTATGEVLMTWSVNLRLVGESIMWRVLGWFGFS